MATKNRAEVFEAEAEHASAQRAAPAGGPDDDGLTDAQRKQESRRLERARKDVPSATASEEAVKSVPLSVMLADGPDLQIGGKIYEVAPFPLGKLSQAAKLIAQCPDVLLTAALSVQGGQTDLAKITETTNRVIGQGGASEVGFTDEAVSWSLSMLTLQIEEEQAEAMTDLILLAVSRKHPEVTREEIAAEVDLTVFFAALVKIFAANEPLKTRL